MGGGVSVIMWAKALSTMGDKSIKGILLEETA
jgi:hypothetical protein